MAEAAAASVLLRMVANKLVPLLEQELYFLSGVHDDTMKLESTLSLIQDVIADAEERSIHERAVHNWLRKLAYIAYDADDVLDEFHTGTLLRRSMLRRGFFHKVSSFFSLSNPIVFRLRMGHMLGKINEKLDVIAEERTRYQLREGVVPEWRSNAAERMTHSFVPEDEVYGRYKDKEKIVDLLINTNHNVDVTVIPIVGMGGIGKTTLAQLVYNDARVREHFGKLIWAYASEVFNLMKIIRSIIGSATDVECHLSDLELLQRRLQEALSGSRYLLVLDDVWTENHQSWEGLMQLLRGGLQGSKIIVTTRCDNVAMMTGTVPPHQLKGLSDEHCWGLFKRRAFGVEGRVVSQRLEAIGKSIVKKCCGVPLAAKSVGGLLQSKSEESEWLAIRDNEIWQLPEDGNGILSALRLSYSHLPSPVKQCLAYCSLYPKGYKFVKDDLIEMWIAEGFILVSGYHEQLEDIGKDYVDLLLSCSFFEVAGKVKWPLKLKMHDLVHDLACSVAAERFLYIKASDIKPIPLRCCHLSIDYPCITSIATIRGTKYKLHSFHIRIDSCMPGEGKHLKGALENVLQALSRLRVLDLRYARIVEVPKHIVKLKHLRYVDLSHTEIESLPECIDNLQNLRTLNVSHCYQLEILPQAIGNLQSLVTLDLRHCVQLRELPKSMNNLTNLKHLKMSNCQSLTKTPPMMGQLSNLRTLTFFVVGKERGCGIEELQFLNHLSGEFSIGSLENVKDIASAVKANLKEKQQLRSLILEWGSSVFHGNVESVFAGLQPHPNLQELMIFHYPGLALPSWMSMANKTSSSPLMNLVTVHLNGLKRCQHLPTLGPLPFLKEIGINQMSMLKSISNEFYGEAGIFPSLEEFYISDMPNLEEWSVVADEVELFPRLTKLTIKNCSNLQALPCLPSVVKLELMGNNEKLFRSKESLRSLNSSLKELRIYECDELTALDGWEGLQGLTALEKFGIHSCGQLTSLPDGMLLCWFASLKHLHITRCRNLVSLGGRRHGTKKQLPAALVTLDIIECERLESLPEWIGELSSLTSLAIISCYSLETLPEGIEGLAGLQSLLIFGCPNLKKE